MPIAVIYAASLATSVHVRPSPNLNYNLLLSAYRHIIIASQTFRAQAKVSSSGESLKHSRTLQAQAKV
jgi:hypothetical protein